tara:strand:- start:202 stop:1362 length:1161 start_codon:yes stop_codon:yes gene_type:complete
MKQFFYSIILLMSFNLFSQNWINDSNCDSQSYEILNDAITHLSNLEQLIAVGMAKAAYLIDNGCECAKLVLAATATNNPDVGTRKSKLDEINIQLLSPEEKAWYNLLVETTKGQENTWSDVYVKAIEKFSDSPLINWVGIGRSGLGWDGYMEFSKKFPKNSSAAFNMIAYGYANGVYGDSPDFESAYNAINKSIELHKGPNAFDSKAEIAAMEGNFQEALLNQLNAREYAYFASPYQPKLTTYLRSVNKDNLTTYLKNSQKKLQEAITNSDLEEYKKYVSDDIDLVTGDSNLGEFYVYSEDDVTRERNFSWDSFDLKDINVNYSPDMTMAVLTFYATGSYTFSDTNKNVKYSTRASSVWIATDDGSWKSVHSNWAPMKGGFGIPSD